MVDLSDYLDADEDAPEPDGEAEDLVALKACLKALADAVASTNLAVLTSTRGDMAEAGARLQASVGALKRFSEAFAVLEGPAAAPSPDEGGDA